MVRLVFCPHGGGQKPGASTRSLPRLVEHAKLSQRVEAGAKATKARSWVGQGWAAPGWAAWVSMGNPAGIPRPNEGMRLPGTGGQHPRLKEPRGPWDRRPAETPASPSQGRHTRDSPGGSVSHPRPGSLGPGVSAGHRRHLLGS